MAKLRGRAKAAFLKRMNKGRLKKGLKAIKCKTCRKPRKNSPKRTKSHNKKRKSQPIRTRKRSHNTVAKKRRFHRARAGISRITGNKFVRGAVLGLGGGALVVQITERFAPQFSGVAGPVGAFVFGGPVGFVAHLLLQGGLGGIFGGGNGDTTNARNSL